MSETQYTFRKLPEIFYYEFESEGPKGLIKKVVRYSLIDDATAKIYNLSFGDWDNHSENINDKIISNNEDRQKILATVADTVIDFTLRNPDAFVFAQGSTPARTRLYQMGISAFFNEISEQFEIIGYNAGEWTPFKKGVNYDAFLLNRKLL